MSINKLDVNSIVILSQFVFLLFLLYYREDHDVNVIYMLIYIYEVSLILNILILCVIIFLINLVLKINRNRKFE